jgi:protein JSN1
MVRTLFFSNNDEVLREVLWDAPNGSQVISKIMVNTSLDQADKPAMVEATRRVLLSMTASNTSPYRRLMEEVGLPITAAPMNSPNRYQPRNNAPYPLPGYGNGVYGMNPYNAPHLAHLGGPQMGGFMQPGHQGSLSPLMIPGGMSFGQALGGNMAGSPIPVTPSPRPMGSPHSQMMSPGSDPFNPVSVYL